MLVVSFLFNSGVSLVAIQIKKQRFCFARTYPRVVWCGAKGVGLGNERVWRGCSGKRGGSPAHSRSARWWWSVLRPSLGSKDHRPFTHWLPSVAHLQLPERPSPGSKEGCSISHLPHQVVARSKHHRWESALPTGQLQTEVRDQAVEFLGSSFTSQKVSCQLITVMLSKIWTVYLEMERNLPKRKKKNSCEIKDIRHCLQDCHCDLGNKWGRRGCGEVGEGRCSSEDAFAAFQGGTGGRHEPGTDTYKRLKIFHWKPVCGGGSSEFPGQIYSGWSDS